MVIGQHFWQDDMDKQIEGAHEPTWRTEPVATGRHGLMGSDELSYPFEIESPAEAEDQSGSSHGVILHTPARIATPEMLQLRYSLRNQTDTKPPTLEHI